MMNRSTKTINRRKCAVATLESLLNTAGVETRTKRKTHRTQQRNANSSSIGACRSGESCSVMLVGGVREDESRAAQSSNTYCTHCVTHKLNL